MSNIGAWPIDPATETGLFRTELGDVVGTPTIPADFTASFQYISDAAIAALILAYPTSRNIAMSRAVSSMATQMIAAAQDIQVDDIKIKTIEQAKLMLEYATSLYNGAIKTDASTAFGVVALTAGHDFSHQAEGIPMSYLTGWKGTPAPYGTSGF